MELMVGMEELEKPRMEAVPLMEASMAFPRAGGKNEGGERLVRREAKGRRESEEGRTSQPPIHIQFTRSLEPTSRFPSDEFDD